MRGTNDQALRRVTGAAVLLVAAIAASVGYLHIYRLAVQLGQQWGAAPYALRSR
jgi:hypothetical protein